MENNYRFEPINEELTTEQVNELEKKISKSISFLEKNLSRLGDYLKKEEEAANYIEINLPKLDSELCFKLNLYCGKIIVSVMKGSNYEIVGHLLINGFDCLDKNEIKRLGRLDTFKRRFHVFKEFSE